MSTGYTTYQQHEPLRAPAGWSVQEKRFVAQLEELFDDIYKRYNRLRMEDMSPAFRKSFKQIMDDGAELRHDLDITASGLSAEITRASTAEGNLSTSISATASGLSAEITRATTAEGNLSTSISATASGLSAEITRATNAEGSLSSSISGTASAMELTFKKIGASGYTATGITTIGENGITVQHSNLNCKTEMSASGFRILNSNNTVIGGVMNLNNQVVTAMQCLYNPSYPTFRLEVGRFDNPVSEGTTLIDGIGFVYNNARRLGIGMEYDAVTGNIVSEKIISTDNYGVVAENKTINMFNGVTGLSLYPTSGSAYGDIQLYHATRNVGVFITDSDVLVSCLRYGRLVTLKASNYFQPED